MPSEQLTLAVDRCPDKRPEKRCSCCRRRKPATTDEFARNRSEKDGLHRNCLLCMRIARVTYYHERGGKAVDMAYQARPEVKVRRREYDRRRRERDPNQEKKRAYNATPRARLAKCRCKARRKLREAATDKRRAELAALIAAYDREIARIDARREAERVAELPAEPIRSRARKYGPSPCRGVYRVPSGNYEVKVANGHGGSVRGGTYATLAEARDAANRLGREYLEIPEYAVPKRRRA